MYFSVLLSAYSIAWLKKELEKHDYYIVSAYSKDRFRMREGVFVTKRKKYQKEMRVWLFDGI